jgi:hypothetical protein
MIIRENDAQYLMRYYAAIENGRENILRPYLSSVCAECGLLIDPFESDAHILDSYANGYVLIGCEGYHQIDPALLGIHSQWDDWTLSFDDKMAIARLRNPNSASVQSYFALFTDKD